MSKANLIPIILILFSYAAYGENKKVEKVDVNSIQKRYWAHDNQTNVGVVQNRLYTKSKKIQLSAITGLMVSDPFLSVKSLGLSVGYHFSEYLSVHAIGWRSFTSGSSALKTLNDFGQTANTVEPKFYAGSEVQWSLLYGKLSLLGKKIIYYDLHLGAGLGVTGTETGDYITPSIGIGQRFYLARSISLRFDYRLMVYKEAIVEKIVTPQLGEITGHRTNFTNAITLGIDFLF